MDARTLAALVLQCRNGDRGAWDALVEQYWQRLYSYAVQATRSNELATDLVQETFLRAYNKLHTFRQDASFLTWLYKIASNLCIDQIRARNSRSALSLDVETGEGREPVAESRTSNPENIVVRNNLQEIIQREVLQLPERYRMVIVMRHLQDMSVEEIARILEIPDGTVKTHLFRGREMLRERLGSLLDVNDGK